ncbi:MAG: LbtU family siderophore porin [Syntrophotaleaceae bacterium]
MHTHLARILNLMALVAALALAAGPAFAAPQSEIEHLKQRIEALEAEAEKAAADSSDQRDSLSLAGLAQKVSFSGLVEVEAGYIDVESDDPAVDGDESDLVLATVELGIDVDFIKHVSGHVLLLWEEDDTEPMDVDEAFIRLDGAEVLPLYLQAGKMYVPFGNFDSHFISDPLTLELGETRESAAIVGYANDLFDLSFGVFNGDIDEEGDDDHIDSFVASAVYTMPEGVVEGLELTGGVSWISNIADSDVLGDEIADGELNDKVGGIAAFVSATLNEKWSLIAEYVGALDAFEAGELNFSGGEKMEPKTWNVELGYAVTDALEVALRYEGGDDLGDLLPDSQYGIVASYALFKNTSLALEYLHGEFENDDEQDLVTAQLAFEF